MTVRLLTQYGFYPPNSLYTGNATDEAKLLHEGRAVADLTGGAAYVAPTKPKYQTPVNMTIQGGASYFNANNVNIPVTLDLNAFDFLGDSRPAQMYADAGIKLRKNAKGWFHQANATPTIKQAMRVGLNLGISGFRSDQALTQANLDACLSSSSGWLVVWCGVNDIAFGLTAAQIWNGWSTTNQPAGAMSTSLGIKSVLSQAANAGKRAIYIAESGNVGMTGNAAQLGEKNKLNAYARDLARTLNNVFYYDIESIVLDPTSAGVAFKSGYSADGTHLVTLGGYAVGVDFAAWIAPRLGGLYGGQIATAADVTANGGLQQFANPLFLTTTGGTPDARTTGNVPANWFVQSDVGITATSAVAAGTVGNDWTLTITAANAGTIQFYYFFNSTSFAPGENFSLTAEVSVANGSSHLCGVSAKHLLQLDSVTYIVEDGYSPTADAAGPTTAYTQTLEASGMVMPPFTTFNQRYAYFVATFDAAGSATVTLRRPAMRKRLAA